MSVQHSQLLKATARKEYAELAACRAAARAVAAKDDAAAWAKCRAAAAVADIAHNVWRDAKRKEAAEIAEHDAWWKLQYDIAAKEASQ